MEVVRSRYVEGAKAARGAVVIIDVFRAFSCAPLFFYYGARKVILEKDPDKALRLKSQIPDSVLVGEVNEIPIQGGDMGNSPTEIMKRGVPFFRDKTVIHRTTAGVVGVSHAYEGADRVILGSFVMASAVANYLKASNPDLVTLVAMGDRGQTEAPEDERCADYFEALLTGKAYDHVSAMSCIIFHNNAQKFIQGKKTYLPKEDPIFCLQRDIFDFVLCVEKHEGLLVVQKLVQDMDQ